MAAVAAPYGLRLTNMQGGQYATHGMRLMPIVVGSGTYATAIFNGDLVDLTAGLITKNVGTTTATPIGVFMGCEYEDTAMGLFHRNYWPASTPIKTGTTAWAYVLDDPDALFEIQAAGPITQASLGLNADLTNPANTPAQLVTGRSIVAMAATAPSTGAARPLRIVDFVRRPGSAVGDLFTDVIVRLNTHKNRTP
jgi:hypothetical protein